MRKLIKSLTCGKYFRQRTSLVDGYKSIYDQREVAKFLAITLQPLLKKSGQHEFCN